MMQTHSIYGPLTKVLTSHHPRQLRCTSKGKTVALLIYARIEDPDNYAGNG